MQMNDKTKRWLALAGVFVPLALVIIMAGRAVAARGSNEPPVASRMQANFTRATEATLVVTSTADSGNGTLRQAMDNAVSGDTITFDTGVFPPGSPVTIHVTTTPATRA